MSHQTGITASQELRDFFARSKDGSVRMIKIHIIEEQLQLASRQPPNTDWESDYDPLVLSTLEEQQPCYIMYRLDEKNETGYQWIYISYSPDYSPVRQKMLYAATRATLKKEFGGGQITEELFGTLPEDVNLVGYKKHLTSQSAPAPLTYAEEELEQIKRTEVNADINVDAKHQTMSGISFPINPDAQHALMELKAAQVTYVQLALDLTEEKFFLSECGNVEAGDLASHFPVDKGRFHFFIFKHTHEGDYQEPIVFIYSMPGYKSSIKERMLYSSSKNPLLDVVEQHMGLEIVRKMEVDDASEVTAEFLQDEVHPKKDIVRQQFARPKGPGGRGPRRLTKPQKQ